MKSSRIAFVAFVLLLVISCGPTYYREAYVTPVYDPGLVVVYQNGVPGYYHGATFYPQVVVNGASGFYNPQGAFVSNHSSVQQAIQNQKPFYTGSSSVKLAPQTTPSTTTYSAPLSSVPASKPNYGTSGGSIGRSAPVPSYSSSPPVATKPNYGVGGSIGRSVPSVTSSVPSKPNYGTGGTIGRSASPTVRPSYGSSSSSSGISRGTKR